VDSIIEAIEEWLRGLLVSGIMNNLNNTFNSVNTQVGEIATEIGTTPASFSPAVFNMIKNLSENVIMPIAGNTSDFHSLLRAYTAGHQP